VCTLRVKQQLLHYAGLNLLLLLLLLFLRLTVLLLPAHVGCQQLLLRQHHLQAARHVAVAEEGSGQHKQLSTRLRQGPMQCKLLVCFSI
jgi:hypothetical protein